MKLSCRPLTLNSYKAFKKNKSRSGKTLCFIFYKVFKKKKKKFCQFYYLTPDLKFPRPNKKILLPAKFYFNPHWGKLLFLSFKKGLNGQNYSSSDSHHHIKISRTAKFPISPIGRYPRVSHSCWEHVGGGGGGGRGEGWRLESLHVGDWGEEGLKCCWKIPVTVFMR